MTCESPLKGRRVLFIDFRFFMPNVQAISPNTTYLELQDSFALQGDVVLRDMISATASFSLR